MVPCTQFRWLGLLGLFVEHRSRCPQSLCGLGSQLRDGTYKLGSILWRFAIPTMLWSFLTPFLVLSILCSMADARTVGGSSKNCYNQMFVPLSLSAVAYPPKQKSANFVPKKQSQWQADCYHSWSCCRFVISALYPLFL